jgi:hypothetical protein
MEMLLVSSPVDIGDVQGSQVHRKEVFIGLESCVRLCHLRYCLQSTSFMLSQHEPKLGSMCIYLDER